MAGVIVEFAPRVPDPDNGLLSRWLHHLARHAGSARLGQSAHAQARPDAEAGRQWALPVDGYED